MPETAPQPVLRAAIYDRASKDKTGGRKSVTEQHEANQLAADRNGWKVTETYADNHRSASRFAREERPDWDRLLASLNARRIDVVILWESSRGDRKASQWIAFLDTCRELGALIHVTTHGRTYDMRVPRDWRTLAEDGVDSTYETERLRERIRRGLRGNAVAGMPHGKITYGYARLYDQHTGRLVGQVPDDRPRVAIRPACLGARRFLPVGEVFTRAGVVREVTERFARGATQAALVRDLNARGVPAPEGGAWRTPQLRNILENPAYIGFRRHQGELVESAWFPPLVAREVHYACTSRLGDPSRRGSRDSSIKHLLSGLAKCGRCGSSMRVLVIRGTARYVCQPTTSERAPGRHPVRSQDRVEAYVERVALLWMAQPEQATVLTQGGEGGGDEHSRIAGQIRELRARLDEHYDQAADGKLSAVGLARVEQRILPQIARLEAESRRLRHQLVLAPARVGGEEEARAEWEAWDVGERREFLLGLFEKIEILPLGQGRRLYRDEESVRLTWRDGV